MGSIGTCGSVTAPLRIPGPRRMSSAYIKVQEGDEVVRYDLGPEAQYKIYIDQEPVIRVWDKVNTRLLAVRYVVMLCIVNRASK